jgi:hypothetical protein
MWSINPQMLIKSVELQATNDMEGFYGIEELVERSLEKSRYSSVEIARIVITLPLLRAFSP